MQVDRCEWLVFTLHVQTALQASQTAHLHAGHGTVGIARKVLVHALQRVAAVLVVNIELLQLSAATVSAT